MRFCARGRCTFRSITWMRTRRSDSAAAGWLDVTICGSRPRECFPRCSTILRKRRPAWRPGNPNSRLFGRADRTWADPLEAAAVDWLPVPERHRQARGALSVYATSTSDSFYTTRKWICAAESKRRVTRSGIGLISSPSIWAANRRRQSIICKCPVRDPSPHFGGCAASFCIIASIIMPGVPGAALPSKPHGTGCELGATQRSLQVQAK